MVQAGAAMVLRVFFTDETYISLSAKPETTTLDLVNQVCRRRNLLDTADQFALYVLDKSQKEGARCSHLGFLLIRARAQHSSGGWTTRRSPLSSMCANQSRLACSSQCLAGNRSQSGAARALSVRVQGQSGRAQRARRHSARCHDPDCAFAVFAAHALMLLVCWMDAVGLRSVWILGEARQARDRLPRAMVRCCQLRVSRTVPH